MMKNASSSSEPRPFVTHGRMAALLIMICAALYAWTADFPMIYDDMVYLRDNPLFLQSAPLPLTEDGMTYVKSASVEPDLAVNRMLRPLAYATFLLNHAFGGFSPRGYRVVNMLLHAGCGWLLYVLLMQLGTKLAGQGRLRKDSAVFIAVTAALVFTVHPLATESVTYIVQRFTSMGAFLLLLALVMHLHALESETRLHSGLWQTGAVLAALAGMLTKEDVFTLPLLAVMIHLLVLRSGWRPALRHTMPLLLCLPVVPLMVMYCSAALNGGVWSLYNGLQLTNSVDMPVKHSAYLISQATVLLEYVRLLIWPTGQNLAPIPPLRQSIFEPAVLLSLAGLVSALAAVLMLARKKGALDARAVLAAAGLLWFLGTLFVSSGLVPLPDLMAEHRTYLPSAGFFILIVCALDWLRLRGAVMTRRLVPALAGAAVLALGCATFMRNEVWRTNETMWVDVVAKQPENSRAWNNLGVHYAEQKRMKDAVACFHRALEIAPVYYYAMQNLSAALLHLNRWRECHEVTTRMMMKWPALQKDVTHVYTLGVSLAGIGRVDEGTDLLRRIVHHDPSHFFAHKALGLIHYLNRRRDSALIYLRRANELSPGDPEVTHLLSQL
jgi:tetratricopeptide (TPR) repeat protein